MIVLLWACLSMAAKDALRVLYTVSVANGRKWRAGFADAGEDLAVVLTTLFGAGQIVLHGWDLRSVGTLAVIALTSFFGTMFWTGYGRA